jgi:integrase
MASSTERSARGCAGDGSPRTLRHFVATRLLASGVDVRTVAGRLGHRNAATTLNVYSHFLTEPDREAAYLMGRLVRAEIDAQADPST